MNKDQPDLWSEQGIDVSGSDALIELLLWSGVVIVLLVAFFVGWRVMRRWYSRSLQNEPNEGIWTLQDLRDLKAMGKISEQEYEAIHQQIVARTKDTTRTDASSRRTPSV